MLYPIDLSRITLQWANTKKWGRGSGGQFHTNHCILSTRASSWCFCSQECGKGLFKFPGVKILCVLYLHFNVSFTFTAVSGMEISETKRFILRDTQKFSLHHKSTIFYSFLKKSLVPVLKTCALFCERQVAFFKCEWNGHESLLHT